MTAIVGIHPNRISVRTMTTATPQLPDNLLRAIPDEGDALEALRRQIDDIFRAHRTASLVGPDGETMEIPASAFHALKLVVQGMARGQTMTLVPHGKELTTQEAADLLHVSRPHLVKLLEAGTIPHYKVGTHRRVRIEDVLAYREARGGVRREKLDELTHLSEELEGGYR
jgi:excisionase family DNA binding protein